MAFFSETKLHNGRMERIRRSWGFSGGIEVSSDGTRGGLALCWKNNFIVQLRSFSSSHIDV